ncbi:MAG TPA: ABC transporter permease [Gemmatimonadaceae bacterium]|nr:ABC transporter permease [Gemmatimonadaceae bacterium]
MLPIRAAIKSLRRSPGFATVSILSLAVALGLVAAVFGLVDGIRNPRTATRDPEQLFAVNMKGTGASGTVTAADLIEVVETRMPTVNEVAFESFGAGEAVFEKNIRLQTSGARVSANWFAVRGVRPVAGRVFSEATADEDAVASVVISERIWKTVFDSDERLERLSLSIDGAAETRRVQVIGVVPIELAAETREDYWLSLPRDVKAFARTTRGVRPLVRLHPGKTHDSLNVDIRNAIEYLTGLHGSDRVGFGFSAWPLAKDPLNISDFEWLLIGAAIAVLVIACSNLANLVLARGVARQHDMAVRLSLGARRSDIIRGVLAECVVIALAGAALGILAAAWGFGLLRASMPERLPAGALVIAMSWRVIALSSGAAILSALVFGLLPALRLSDIQLSEHIKENSGTTTSRKRVKFPALVIGQVALSLAMLTGVALLIRASQEVRAVDFGFDPARLLQVSAFSRVRADTAESVRLALWAATETRLRQYATVEAVAWRSYVDTKRSPGLTGERTGGAFRTRPFEGYSYVSPNYLRTIGIGIGKGRDFADHDALGEGVVIVDSVTALKIWGSEDPIGKLVKFGQPDRISPWFRVIGVSRPMRSDLQRHAGEERPAQVYFVGKAAFSKPFGEPGIKPIRAFVPQRAFIVRAKAKDIAALRLEIPRTMRSALPARGIVGVYGFDDQRQEMLAQQRFFSRVLGTFGLLALALCAVGLFSVLSYSVSQRMREHGIRVALGASSKHIFTDVLHEGAILVVAGTAVGGLATIWTNKLVDPYIGMLYHIDVRALVAAEFVLVAVALLAMMRPALRATKTDPVQVLRAV